MRSASRFGVLFLTVRLVGGVECAAGQVAPGSPADTERLAVLFGGLSTGRSVQIVTSGRVFQEAAYLSLGAAEVRLEEGGAPTSVVLGDIRAVSVRSSHWLQGTLWGLGSGLLVGSVTGLLINSFSCTTVTGCSTSEAQGAFWGGIGLGVATGALGFVVGRRQKYWRQIYP